MKTFREFLNEAENPKITDYDKWESMVMKMEPRAKITKEGDGGSQALIASVPGSPQMVGKWFGPWGVIYKGRK